MDPTVDPGITHTIGVQTLVGMLVSAFMPKLLNWLKDKHWAPMTWDNATVNRWCALLTALLTSLGVHYTFDAASGRLVVDGLFWDQILFALVNAALNFGTQEAVYRKWFNDKVPAVLLAVGLSVTMLGCAKSAPVLVATDQSVSGALLRVKGNVDGLCNFNKPVLSVDLCKTLYGTLTPALEAGDAFNRAAFDQKFAGLTTLATAISRLMEAVKLVPQELRGSMEFNLVTALSNAVKQ